MSLAVLMPAAQSVIDSMVRSPKTCSEDTTVGDARRMLADDHVHALLLVRGDRLIAVVQRDDIRGADDLAPAAAYGQLSGRCTSPFACAVAARSHMIQHGIRRLAVVDGRDRLLGLLCLKNSRRGFCTDVDVGDRAVERTNYLSLHDRMGR